jgi:hypothetical protein
MRGCESWENTRFGKRRESPGNLFLARTGKYPRALTDKEIDEISGLRNPLEVPLLRGIPSPARV